jgi:hypothetical protein
MAGARIEWPPITLDRQTIQEVCEDLQDYITLSLSDASMLSMAIIWRLDAPLIRHIALELLERDMQLVPAGFEVENLPFVRKITAVWRALRGGRLDVVRWVHDEIRRRRRARTEEHGAYGPSAAAGPASPGGPERTDGRMLCQMRSHLTRVL